MANPLTPQPPGEKCNARKKSGEYCKLPAGYGTDHVGAGRCKYHLGSTARQHNVAMRIIAGREVKALGLELPPGSIDPRDALAEELWRTRCAIEVLGLLMSELGLDPGTGQTKDGLYGPTFHATGQRTGEGKPHVLWVMWREERAHYTVVAEKAHKAGVESRRIALDEGRAAMMADLIRYVLGHPDMMLEENRRTIGLQLAAGRLRELAT